VNPFCFEAINWSPYFWTPDLPDCPPPAERIVAAAAAADFRWISFDELALAAEVEAGRPLSALRKQVEKAGLRVLALHSVALNEDRAATISATEAFRPALAELGASWVQVGATSPIGPQLFESTRAAAGIVAQEGARLAIEFLPFLPVASIEQTRSLIEAATSSRERAAIVPDSWHFFHGPDDWDDLASLRPDELAYVQFDDHPSLESDDLLLETTQRRVPPGSGTFDLARFAATLRASGFEGPVGLEHLSRADRVRPVEDVAIELARAAGPYWSAN
jgi:sugar phosphate isomerase/epimerase